MATAADSTAEQASDPLPHDPSEEPRNTPDQPDRAVVNEFDFDEEEEDAEDLDGPAAEAAFRERSRRAVIRRIYSDPVEIHVHSIIIKGNLRTRDSLIQAEVADLLRSASTLQELLYASKFAGVVLHRLNIFESVSVTLDAGPPELPRSANVVIEVVESNRRFVGGIQRSSKPQVKISDCNRIFLVNWL
jgi:outer membrane protein insertion porin family